MQILQEEEVHRSPDCDIRTSLGGVEGCQTGEVFWSHLGLPVTGHTSAFGLGGPRFAWALTSEQVVLRLNCSARIWL